MGKPRGGFAQLNREGIRIEDSQTHELVGRIKKHSTEAVVSLMRTKLFAFVAIAVFVVAALAKMISAYQPVGILNLKDPLFDFMTTRQLLLGVAAIELVVVIVILWLRHRPHQLVLIAWLSTMFLLYRVGVHWAQPPGAVLVPCPCMGNAAAWLHIDAAHLDSIVKIILACLLLGSYGLLAWDCMMKPTTGRSCTSVEYLPNGLG